MVSTPHPPATAPRAPVSRAESLPQTPPRPSHPQQQQDSKFLHASDGTVVNQKELLVLQVSPEQA